MAAIKTTFTGASVSDYLASRASPQQLKDCRTLMAICRRVTKQPPLMWGPSIVGYGKYRYTYESGHSGEACVVGFAVRGRELVVYLDVGSPAQAKRLQKLGKHRMTKTCLYLKRLEDVNLVVLEELIAHSAASVRGRFA